MKVSRQSLRGSTGDFTITRPECQDASICPSRGAPPCTFPATGSQASVVASEGHHHLQLLQGQHKVEEALGTAGGDPEWWPLWGSLYATVQL